ncbi:MAG: hypothetical protein L3J88_13245 [Gammaproteobacteria bacterium]|nr:hypothetical protein [Gammaproteobacteria bacterium]
MSTRAVFVGILIAFVFIVMIFFILFGQITVRKLRKNPETKQALGIEFASGLDILNVAQALTLPKSVAQKIRNNPTGALHADPDLLYKYTTLLDRILARVFYALFVLTGTGGIVLVILSWFGDFD